MNRLFKKVLATALAATLLAMPMVAGATDQPTPAATPFVEVTESAPISVGGQVIKSDVSGAFSIPKNAQISGVVVRQSSDTIKAAAGLGKNEKPFVTAYEITAKSSPKAYASFNGAAASVGATVLDALNIDLGKVAGGKVSDLPAGVSVPTTVGVKNPGGKTLAVAKVLPGGATEIIPDTDDNPNTVTFPITGGPAAYAIIAY